MRFHDRTDAGQRLAEALTHYEGRDDVLVLALPRGGVPVAAEVAKRLHAPLDLMLVRKLGVPGHEELAMGAIATGGSLVLNQDLIDNLGIRERAIETVMASEQEELRRREEAYRGDRPLPTVEGRAVIVVDDGVATGATMRVAIKALRQQAPARVVAAVPVAPPDTANVLREDADEVVALEKPAPFYGVGYWYHSFGQTSDQEVRDLLIEAWSGPYEASRRPELRPRGGM